MCCLSFFLVRQLFVLKVSTKLSMCERENEWRPEIFGGFGGKVGEDFHLDTTGGNGADGDIEEDDGVFRVWGPLVPLHRSISTT